MKHLTSDELSAHLDHTLTGRAGEEAERHLSTCEACREALTALAAQDAALRPALTHEPGEAYFESFAGRVGDRIRATGLAGAQARGHGFEFGRLFRSPRMLTWAGAAAVVLVGAGLALMTGREVRPPDLRDQDLSERSQQVSPEAPKPMEAVPAPSAANGEAAPHSETAARERDDTTRLKKESMSPQEEIVSRGALQEDEERGEPGRKNRPTARRTTTTGGRVDRLTVPSPSPATGQTSPGRAVGMQRTATGEDVPVPRPGVSPPVPPASVGATAEGAEQNRKKAAAEALKQRSTWGATKSLYDYSSAEKPASPSRGDSFAKPPEMSPLDVTASPPVAHPSYASKQILLAPGEAQLCGEVRDAAGRPVVGAQVSVADVGRTAITDARGAFCVNAPAGEHPLSVMAIGFAESRRNVRVGGDRTVRVTLEAVSVLEDKRGVAGGPALLRVAPPGEPRDAYATLPDTLRAEVRAVQQLQSSATSRRSAGMFDAAAAGWERALRRLVGGPLELETRHHLAEARYRAWEAGPNGRRAVAAVEALTAYAVRAPAGAEREQAIHWLDRVRQ